MELDAILSFIQENQTQMNSVKDTRNIYTDQFDRIGSFTGEYQIVLKLDNHPVFLAPRKYPIYMRDEIKTALDDMMEQGIIRRVRELHQSRELLVNN